MKINEEDSQLNYYCRNCGDIEIPNSSLLISEVTYEKNKKNEVSINEYIKYDSTIPYLTNIICPNINCKSNTDSSIEKNVIYYRYDNENMKYIYLCTHCDSSWKP
tara:strand:- start:56 stop:370 length:315 start_codon:yes stop_codon:yes gene_type:complete